MFVKRCGEFLFRYAWRHQQSKSGKLSKKDLESVRISLTVLGPKITNTWEWLNVQTVVPSFITSRATFQLFCWEFLTPTTALLLQTLVRMETALIHPSAKTHFCWKNLQVNILNLLSGNALPGTDGPTLPSVFIGDGGFDRTNNLLRQFGGKNQSLKKKIFTSRLCRVRRYIECTVGILTSKWRIFHRTLNDKIDFAE
jgi:hypothetical protein